MRLPSESNTSMLSTFGHVASTLAICMQQLKLLGVIWRVDCAFEEADSAYVRVYWAWTVWLHFVLNTMVLEFQL